MVAFFKALGMGLLYVVTLPLIIVALAIGIVYCFILFLVLAVKALVSFFSGRSIFRDLEEDLLADRIYEANVVNAAASLQAAKVARVEAENQEVEEEEEE